MINPLVMTGGPGGRRQIMVTNGFNIIPLAFQGGNYGLGRNKINHKGLVFKIIYRAVNDGGRCHQIQINF